MQTATQGSNKTIILVSLIAALAGLLFGFDTGIISGALIFIKKSYHVSTGMQEMIVGAVLIGAIIGSISSGALTDKFGRRGIILIISLIFIFGTLTMPTPMVAIMEPEVL